MSQHNFRRPFRAFNPVSAFNRVGTSISRWCSSDCECPLPKPPSIESQQCMEPGFLFLTQDTGFTLEAGQPFPFSGRAVVSGDSFLCEEEFLAYWNMNDCREERWRPSRRPCRCSCNNECPEFSLCCLPIIDEDVSSELCMCGVCGSEIDRCECYHFENGVVFLAPGVYLIEYSILLPRGVIPNTNALNPVYTEVHLVANGMTIPGSSRIIAHSGETTETVQVKVLYEACSPTSLSLVTTDAMTLMPIAEGDLLVTMTINGLC